MSAVETAAVAPLVRHGQIEVDTFCTRCYYNLHGQTVTLDDRLGFPICRCPECGQFHPAGVGVSASSIWTRRFATALLISWSVFVIVTTLAILLAIGGTAASSVGVYESGTYVKVANPGPRNFGRSNRSNEEWVYTLRPVLGSDAEVDPPASTILFISSISLGLGFVLGWLCVTFLWHWPGRRYYLCLLLPIIPAGLLMMVYRNSNEYRLILGECLGRVGCQAALASLGIAIGVVVGRAISRTLARVIIPPKPRQAIAFLWKVDNKPLPADMLAAHS